MVNQAKSGKRIFISAGEISGDIQGAHLIRELKRDDASLIFDGLGGDKMAAEGVKLLFHCRDLAFMGFTEVLKHLPFIRTMFRNVHAYISKYPPDAAILIDYPGFNLRLAKKLATRNIPVFYYISPQLWAWGKRRVKKVQKYIKRILCIFPFEPEWYAKYGVLADYVGHPLTNLHKPELSCNEFYRKINKIREYRLIGLFPGSRQQEVDRHLMPMLDALEIINQKTPIQTVIVKARGVKIYREIVNSYTFPIEILDALNAEVQSYSDLIITSSGTTTLETALCGTPMIVIYRISPFSFLLGKLLINVDHIAMPNIIAGERVVPELIQNDANPARIAEEAGKILDDGKRYKNIRQSLEKIRQLLGDQFAPRRAAEIILSELDEKKT